MLINWKKTLGIFLIFMFAIILIVMLYGMMSSSWIPNNSDFHHVVMPHPDKSAVTGVNGFSYTAFMSIFIILEIVLAIFIAWLFTSHDNDYHK